MRSLYQVTCKPPIIRFRANESESSGDSDDLDDSEELPPQPQPDEQAGESSLNESDTSLSSEKSSEVDSNDLPPVFNATDRSECHIIRGKLTD
eukprot:595712-Hanusia_phi.AAC.1